MKQLLFLFVILVLFYYASSQTKLNLLPYKPKYTSKLDTVNASGAYKIVGDSYILTHYRDKFPYNYFIYHGNGTFYGSVDGVNFVKMNTGTSNWYLTLWNLGRK